MARHLHLQRIALRPMLVQLLAQHVDLLLQLPQPPASREVRLRRLCLELLELLQELRVLVGEEREIGR
jgi:hypothetical protein